MRRALLLILPLAACAAPPPPAPTLIGPTWMLVELANAPVTVPISLTLTGERASGAGPCNTYFGAWRGTAEGVSIGPVAATRRACPELPLEQSYFGGLTDAAEAVIDGATLTLRDAGGAVLMRFRLAG